ncbi:radical SAM protein [Dissulfurispira thermophila]|uniref:Radical SAM protein n=2 Tax=root TaxID=1 RepID=A0A7G1H3K4_9BACT|nr:TatD family hydrolase [Dissulfurispira thermophila]BCB97385.1 radical SAM protein [Dissulfurispira thermophila]
MIDTHCHLEMEAFDPDRDDVIKRAEEAGLEAVITIGSDFDGCRGAVELASKYDFIYASVGIHPHDAKDFSEEIFDQIKRWATNRSQKNKNSKIVAIGEIGLDYHYDHSPRDIQRDVFKKQLYYAKEVNLPVIIHCRDASKETLKILEESGVTKGVMHCFSGDMDMAERVMGMGFYISIAGPVTFKNATRLREVARAIPDDYLLLETDAPYLSPEPLRGKRNEPANIIHTAKFIAELRGISYEDINRITTLNAKRLFGIGKMPEAEIAYRIRDSLYLNITNRCTSKCTFCVKFHTDFVKGHKLRLEHEPTEEELKKAIGDPTKYDEIVFCGYGEPLIRLDIVKSIALWIKERGGKVRINTNGHGNLIHKRNILPELRGLIDSVSISLDAQDEETYNRICKPAFKNAYKEVVNFIREAKKYIPDVTATIVTAEGVDVDKCREITDSIGVKLRVRRLDVVG